VSGSCHRHHPWPTMIFLCITGSECSPSSPVSMADDDDLALHYRKSVLAILAIISS
jgi:hypothetical protein